MPPLLRNCSFLLLSLPLQADIAEDLPHLVMDDKGRFVVGRRRIAVDEDELFSSEIVEEARRRIDAQRRARDDQGIGRADLPQRAGDRGVVEPLFIAFESVCFQEYQMCNEFLWISHFE